jgi:hypothetical protein
VFIDDPVRFYEPAGRRRAAFRTQTIVLLATRGGNFPLGRAARQLTGQEGRNDRGLAGAVPGEQLRVI